CRPGPDRARLPRRARPARDGGPRPPGGHAVTGARTRALGAGLAGGLVAGAWVGAAEALAAGAHVHARGELPALGWGLVAYGAVGAGLGLGAGVVAAVLGTDGFGLALAAVGAALAFAVARFRIVRDVFLEQVPRGPLALTVQVGALVAGAAIAFALWRALRGADERRAGLTRPGDAALGGDHPDRSLPVLARRGPQGGPPARAGRHAGGKAPGHRLPHGRLRRQREHLPGLQLPAGLRRVPLPRARLLLRRERAGVPARALQRAPPRARALPRALRGRASLLSTGRGGDGRGPPLARPRGGRAAVLPLRALHGPARSVLRSPVQRRGLRARRPPEPAARACRAAPSTLRGRGGVPGRAPGRAVRRLQAPRPLRPDARRPDGGPRRGVPRARRLVARHDALRRADPRAAHREAAGRAR